MSRPPVVRRFRGWRTPLPSPSAIRGDEKLREQLLVGKGHQLYERRYHLLLPAVRRGVVLGVSGDRRLNQGPHPSRVVRMQQEEGAGAARFPVSGKYLYNCFMRKI